MMGHILTPDQFSESLHTCHEELNNAAAKIGQAQEVGIAQLISGHPLDQVAALSIQEIDHAMQIVACVAQFLDRAAEHSTLSQDIALGDDLKPADLIGKIVGAPTGTEHSHL